MVLASRSLPAVWYSSLRIHGKRKLRRPSLQDRECPQLFLGKSGSIAAEIATVSLFLHRTKPSHRVHRDLKPINILLDNNYIEDLASQLITAKPPMGPTHIVEQAIENETLKEIVDSDVPDWHN
ncbi:hypothetical protein OIU79_016899 [Salix purpurea]|uniref:RING-type E3 ubiquitin transferase n=1 Tax=Salix purpurea TaxID=77065 RepID=A0A9Q0PFI8_SALPP|nr:hypothetical protein OIU79_016899 [Salix purpurea]